MNSRNPVNPAHPADPSVLNARYIRLIHRQRLAVLVLLVSLIAAVFVARSAAQRAEQYGADVLRLKDQLQSQPIASARMPAPESDQPNIAAHATTATAYYPATLIGEDGARTPLEGRALHIDLGGERLLEVDLARQEKGWLYMWSPARREETHYNRVVFHPHCSNAYSLELDRVALRSGADNASDSAEATVTAVATGAADSVRYQQPH